MSEKISTDKHKNLSKSEVRELWGEQFRELCSDSFITVFPDLIRVRLITPIKSGNGTLDYIDLREPEAEDLDIIDAAKGDFGRVRRVVEACTELTSAECGRIKSRDLTRLSKVTACFLA